ncbi:MAG: ion channel [Steroidobacteraceae bacterium]
MPRSAPVVHTLATGRRFVRDGLPRRRWQDLYHVYMTISWPRLFASFAAFLAAFNLLFAGVYWLGERGIAHLNPPGFWGCFFFSVETLATVGYGDMHPQTIFTHVVASVEIFTGMMSLAVIAGMMFARFSRPTARILFARYAVIRPLDGEPTLMLRAANERHNVIMEAQARLRLVRDERTVEGYAIRRIHDLPLRRSEQPAFLYGWTLMHTLTPDSPLAGATLESLQGQNAFLVLTLSGIDETTGQTLMARREYSPETLRWHHTFADILTTGEDGVDYLDYTKFHDVAPLE